VSTAVCPRMPTPMVNLSAWLDQFILGPHESSTKLEI
jgi:hypothetical protein